MMTVPGWWWGALALAVAVALALAVALAVKSPFGARRGRSAREPVKGKMLGDWRFSHQELTYAPRLSNCFSHLCGKDSHV